MRLAFLMLLTAACGSPPPPSPTASFLVWHDQGTAQSPAPVTTWVDLSASGELTEVHRRSGVYLSTPQGPRRLFLASRGETGTDCDGNPLPFDEHAFGLSDWSNAVPPKMMDLEPQSPKSVKSHQETIQIEGSLGSVLFLGIEIEELDCEDRLQRRSTYRLLDATTGDSIMLWTPEERSEVMNALRPQGYAALTEEHGPLRTPSPEQLQWTATHLSWPPTGKAKIDVSLGGLTESGELVEWRAASPTMPSTYLQLMELPAPLRGTLSFSPKGWSKVPESQRQALFTLFKTP